MNLNQRFWEIDFLRGTAVILMIIFHFLFDLNFFGVFLLNLSSGFLWFFPRIIAGIFILLVGISLYLSYTRTEILGQYPRERDLFIKYLKRGVWIFSLGLTITLATWIFIPTDFIIFGILHFIGLAIILGYPFLKYNKTYRYLNLVLGLLIVSVGIYLTQFTFNFNWLLWVGFVPQNLYTVDYFPLLPWLGVVSFGIFTGSVLYRNYTRKFQLPDLSRYLPIKIFTFLGRHSLIVYFIHQPILIGLLYFFGVLNLSYFF
ncbi:MAG TPA: heparan-alpha-glucosaminide N-acetyltransferase [Methanobacterium sp.]|nr:heparan-alpha-glucosaminide N-acetyltransferase [Methanobacterium sp.]